MIEPLKLDDLRYDALLRQARALIPLLCPEWTDHNPSDPGITLVELLAWLTEMVSYRQNRVPQKSYRAFLNLLDGSPVDAAAAAQAPQAPPWIPALPDAIRRTVSNLRDVDRVVTLEDLAYLIGEKWPRSEEAKKWSERTKLSPQIKRVRCEAGRPIIVYKALQLVDLPRSGGVLVGKNTLLGVEVEDRVSLTPAAGHLSAMVITDVNRWPAPSSYAPSPELINQLVDPRDPNAGYLGPRRLLTSRLHVIGPRVLKLRVSATLHLRVDGRADVVRKKAEDAIWSWLHPLTGGPDAKGWPFGRRIHVSDIYEWLESVPGLDYVEDAKLFVHGKEQVSGVDMSDHEIVVRDETSAFTIEEWTGG